MMSVRRSALLDHLVADRTRTSQHEILVELRRAILDGGVPPGTPIPPAEVADLFGVSPIPIREALKTLVAEGLVTHRRNGGYTIALLTAQELREMYIVRETLESASLTAAVYNATDADRAAAVLANQRLEQAINDGDAAAYHRGSRQFHAALTAPSRMHRLLHVGGGMECHRAGPVDGPCQSLPSGRAARRSSRHAGGVPCRRCGRSARGCRTPCRAPQCRHRDTAARYRPVGLRNIFLPQPRR